MTIAMDRDQYAELVRAFPPRPIHSVREYNATVAVMNKLAVREEDSLTAAEQDYLDALSTFVERYDEEHFPQEEETSPLERLQYLIKEAGLSASDLGRLLGNRGLGSILLTGKRELSKTHIRVLVDHFKINPSYFF
jgi:HTH-type transcriptional regulator / antitoxin HigA